MFVSLTIVIICEKREKVKELEKGKMINWLSFDAVAPGSLRRAHSLMHDTGPSKATLRK
jgi:hypothetical protein